MGKWATALLAALASGIAITASAQQPIRLVLGFPAGGSSDILSRLIADKMRTSLGQPVIVENRAGGGGNIATLHVKNAEPDGRTILLAPSSTMVIYPHVFGDLNYDPFVDFAPVALLTDWQMCFAVGTNVAARTLSQYFALVKKDSKYANYGSPALGSTGHFGGTMLARSAGLELVHIPYKGTAPVINALVAGEISAASVVIGDAITQHRAGKLRIIGVSGAQRAPFLPDVPTYRELGLDLAFAGWYGLMAPAKTPPATVARIAKASIDAVRAPDVRERLDNLGLEATGLSPAEFAPRIKADFENWGAAVRVSGYKPAR